jgi:putative FmdB family regulatory protein
MPIYEYICSACGHRTDIVHGIAGSGPNFCPECGTEGSMRKAFAAPAILFKGSGWAKKDRAATAKPAAKKEGSTTDGGGAKTESSISSEATGSGGTSTSASAATD